MKKLLSIVLMLSCCLLIIAAVAVAEEHDCTKTRSLPIKSGKLYKDYYGSAVTSDTSILHGFRWGITNPKPQSMAYFGGTMKATGSFASFRAKIYIDDGIKAPMEFSFKNKDRNGELLKSVTVEPGETVEVKFDTGGSKQIFVQSELRINHDTAKRIVIGEPEFYSCIPK
ncbi:MAG: hypothetical protein PHN92_09565 [Geobacter sp.]|nr:hypothetical protein [Geobacter sp.]